jgi:hypothetical protein
MNDLQATFVLVLMFALRCIAPLALTLVIGYLMNRLVDRWEAEEAAERLGSVVTASPRAGGRSRRALSELKLPCWVFRNCDPESRENCPAYQQPGLACWLARKKIEGRLPGDCPGCPLYGPAYAVAGD